MKSILDPTFVYVDSTHTNIRVLFERVRAERAKNPPKVDTYEEQLRKARIEFALGAMNDMARLSAQGFGAMHTVVPVKPVQ